MDDNYFFAVSVVVCEGLQAETLLVTQPLDLLSTSCQLCVFNVHKATKACGTLIELLILHPFRIASLSNFPGPSSQILLSVGKTIEIPKNAYCIFDAPKATWLKSVLCNYRQQAIESSIDYNDSAVLTTVTVPSFSANLEDFLYQLPVTLGKGSTHKPLR